MRVEDKKYVWWGLLGIGVAALFYFLSSKNQKTKTNTVTVPYLVPSTMSNSTSPSADTSLSSQPNIVGNSPNNPFPNGTNPYGVNPNYAEAPNTWGFMPQLPVTNPAPFPQNNVQSGTWPSDVNNVFWQNAVPQVQSPVHA